MATRRSILAKSSYWICGLVSMVFPLRWSVRCSFRPIDWYDRVHKIAYIGR